MLQIKLKDVTKLGDFLIPIFSKPLLSHPYRYYLSTKIIKETRTEMNEFLNVLLVNITGEKELTWNLLDAVDIFMVTGINKPIVFKIYYKK